MSKKKADKNLELNTLETVDSIEVSTPKAKSSIVAMYKVEELFNHIKDEKLAPQVKALFAAVKANVKEDGSIIRSEVFAAWKEATSTESGEKVFASYIHQFIAYGFISRIVVEGTAKPRKTLTSADRIDKVKATLGKMSAEDRAAILAALAG
jgi:hypothetical protein